MAYHRNPGAPVFPGMQSYAATYSTYSSPQPVNLSTEKPSLQAPAISFPNLVRSSYQPPVSHASLGDAVQKLSHPPGVSVDGTALATVHSAQLAGNITPAFYPSRMTNPHAPTMLHILNKPTPRLHVARSAPFRNILPATRKEQPLGPAREMHSRSTDDNLAYLARTPCDISKSKQRAPVPPYTVNPTGGPSLTTVFTSADPGSVPPPLLLTTQNAVDPSGLLAFNLKTSTSVPGLRQIAQQPSPPIGGSLSVDRSPWFAISTTIPPAYTAMPPKATTNVQECEGVLLHTKMYRPIKPAPNSLHKNTDDVKKDSSSSSVFDSCNGPVDLTVIGSATVSVASAARKDSETSGIHPTTSKMNVSCVALPFYPRSILDTRLYKKKKRDLARKGEPVKPSVQVEQSVGGDSLPGALYTDKDSGLLTASCERELYPPSAGHIGRRSSVHEQSGAPLQEPSSSSAPGHVEPPVLKRVNQTHHTLLQDMQLPHAQSVHIQSHYTDSPLDEKVKHSEIFVNSAKMFAPDNDSEEWSLEKFLAASNCRAVPGGAFKHVQESLQNGFVDGMKVETPLHEGNSEKYWLATIKAAYGTLLKLRFDGYAEGKDFLLDAHSGKVQPIGWCAKNHKSLLPPADIRHTQTIWKDFLMRSLQGAKTVPTYLLAKGQGPWNADRVQVGMRLEIQHALIPTAVWIARVVENFGGRLRVRYEGAASSAHDIWIFYLHERLHPCGWAVPNHCIYKPPDEIKKEQVNCDAWSNILHNVLNHREIAKVPPDLFPVQSSQRPHCFEVGHKLEVVHPEDQSQICPATVSAILNPYYIVIEVDDLRTQIRKVSACFHGESPFLLPVKWCLQHSVKLTPPAGWSKADFDWSEYLMMTNTYAAPENCFKQPLSSVQFGRGMLLEAVHPDRHEKICVAIVNRVLGRLLYLQLCDKDGPDKLFFIDADSTNLFPIGWCESNGYPIEYPCAASLIDSRVNTSQQNLGTDDHYESRSLSDQSADSEYGPKVYINQRCFSGPLLSKGGLADLPSSVGPGPVHVVLREVLTHLINIAYKSSRVLRELQRDGPVDPNMVQQRLRAKYKGKSYQADIDLCKKVSQLAEFCRQTCNKLECCPNLLSLTRLEGPCPESCHELTKTKYTWHYGRKLLRKPGRPPGGHTNLENGARTRRKKRRKHVFIHRKAQKDYPDYMLDGSSNSEMLSSPSRSVNSQQEKTDVSQSPMHNTGLVAVTSQSQTIPQYEIVKRKRGRPPKGSTGDSGGGWKSIVMPPCSRLTVPPLKIRRLELSPSSTPTDGAQGLLRTGKPQMPSALTFTHYRQHISEEEKVILTNNPLDWGIDELSKFLLGTDCANLVDKLKENDIDGQAFLMLVLPTAQEHLNLKLGPALKLCHHVQRLKLAFFEAHPSS